MKKSGSQAARSGTDRQGSPARAGGYNYIGGSAARKLQEAPAKKNSGQRHKQSAPQGKRQPSQQPRPKAKQHVKAAPMNMGYIAVMAIALCIVCSVLMSYIKLQSDITNYVTSISRLESQLNEMRLSNDETYTKIMSSIDLEEIKRIAVNELGMKYAKEGQVVEYTGEGNDYVRQYRDIP